MKAHRMKPTSLYLQMLPYYTLAENGKIHRNEQALKPRQGWHINLNLQIGRGDLIGATTEAIGSHRDAFQKSAKNVKTASASVVLPDAKALEAVQEACFTLRQHLPALPTQAIPPLPKATGQGVALMLAGGATFALATLCKLVLTGLPILGWGALPATLLLDAWAARLMIRGFQHTQAHFLPSGSTAVSSIQRMNEGHPLVGQLRQSVESIHYLLEKHQAGELRHPLTTSDMALLQAKVAYLGEHWQQIHQAHVPSNPYRLKLTESAIQQRTGSVDPLSTPPPQGFFGVVSQVYRAMSAPVIALADAVFHINKPTLDVYQRHLESGWQQTLQQLQAPPETSATVRDLFPSSLAYQQLSQGVKDSVYGLPASTSTSVTSSAPWQNTQHVVNVLSKRFPLLGVAHELLVPPTPPVQKAP